MKNKQITLATHEELKEHSKAKKLTNKEKSTKLLKDNNIKFKSVNNGIHLIVSYGKGKIDFYPSTGLWLVRGQKFKKRGVYPLMEFIKNKGVN